MRAHIFRLAQSSFDVYDSTGTLSDVGSEAQARVLARGAFYRIATKGASSGPPVTVQTASSALHDQLLHIAPGGFSPALITTVRSKGTLYPVLVESPSLAGDAAGAAGSGAGVGAGSRPASARSGADAGAVTAAPRSLTLEDFIIAFGAQHTDEASRHMVVAAFSLADSDNDGSVTLTEFEELYATMHRSWSSARGSITGAQGAHRVLERIINAVFWLVAAAFALTVFDVNVASVLLPLGTLLVAGSFATAQSITALVNGLVFVVIQRHYEVGDLVLIAQPSAIALGTSGVSGTSGTDSGPLRVVEINVLSTVFDNAESKRIVVPHTALAAMAIVNLRASGASAIAVACRIAFDTPDEKLEALRAALQAYVFSLPNVWRPELHWECGAMKSGEFLELWLRVAPIFPWGETARIAAARSNLNFALIAALRRLGISATQHAAEPTA